MGRQMIGRRWYLHGCDAPRVRHAVTSARCVCHRNRGAHCVAIVNHSLADRQRKWQKKKTPNGSRPPPEPTQPAPSDAPDMSACSWVTRRWARGGGGSGGRRRSVARGPWPRPRRCHVRRRVGHRRGRRRRWRRRSWRWPVSTPAEGWAATNGSAIGSGGGGGCAARSVDGGGAVHARLLPAARWQRAPCTRRLNLFAAAGAPRAAGVGLGVGVGEGAGVGVGAWGWDGASPNE